MEPEQAIFFDGLITALNNFILFGLVVLFRRNVHQIKRVLARSCCTSTVEAGYFLLKVSWLGFWHFCFIHSF
jgi:hypothetical protein